MNFNSRPCHCSVTRGFGLISVCSERPRVMPCTSQSSLLYIFSSPIREITNQITVTVTWTKPTVHRLLASDPKRRSRRYPWAESFAAPHHPRIFSSPAAASGHGRTAMSPDSSVPRLHHPARAICPPPPGWRLLPRGAALEDRNTAAAGTAGAQR